ncbi:GSA [Symbiodinium sp. CCMP2592]|nr:GSA [Symbiodinium sp. CCMP2592]
MRDKQPSCNPMSRDQQGSAAAFSLFPGCSGCRGSASSSSPVQQGHKSPGRFTQVAGLRNLRGGAAQRELSQRVKRQLAQCQVGQILKVADNCADHMTLDGAVAALQTLARDREFKANGKDRRVSGLLDVYRKFLLPDRCFLDMKQTYTQKEFRLMKTEIAAFCAIGAGAYASGALQSAFVPAAGKQENRGHLRASHVSSQAPSTASSSSTVVLASAAAGMAVAVGSGKGRRVRTQQKARGGFDTVKSEEVFTEAKTLMPGGVSSPVRAFKSVGGNPVVFDRVKGANAWDVDGNEYVDYVGTWGPAIIGHADDTVLKALNEQMQKGTSFGAPCALENELAKMVIDAVPSVEMVRFTNSGTEACMGMLRLVRAFTKRDVVIKFEGCYHGHGDAFLVQAGSGVATLGLPDSPGVPKGATTSTLCAQYNNLESVEELLKENEVAAVILEPVVGNSGFIPPTKEFLEGLRELTTKYGALLVFDEVMTGFRIAYGGAQEHFGVTPDVTTMGKVIGGGLPVGAYGGRKDIMEMVAPAGPMYQAGTLSGNPLAMTAGIETLKRLKEPGSYEHLDKITSKLINGILDAARENGHKVCGGHISGMFGFFFCEGPVTCFADATKSDTEKFAKWHRMMLKKGIYLAPSQYEAGFTSLAHTEEDIEKTIAAAKEVFAEL